MITGLWDANVDQSPTIALTGQVDSQVLGTGNFQEVDLEAAYGDVAEFEATVLPDSQHAELATRAAKTAILERGVSHLIFPDEIQTRSAEGVEPGDPEGRITERDITPPDEALEDAVGLLETAARPVIIVGHGARFEMDGIIELAERPDCPILTTFKANGQIPDSHPLAGGVLGRSGTPIARHFMNVSDLLAVFELDLLVFGRDHLHLIQRERGDQEAEEDHGPDHDRLAPTVATEVHCFIEGPDAYKRLRPASQS